MKLNHKNIIKLQHAFLKNQELIMIIEFAPGGNLHEFMVSKGKDGNPHPLREDEIQKILNQVFGAMIYCHSHSTIHRDIKPLNILLSKQNDLSILKVPLFSPFS